MKEAVLTNVRVVFNERVLGDTKRVVTDCLWVCDLLEKRTHCNLLVLSHPRGSTTAWPGYNRYSRWNERQTMRGSAE